MQRTSRRTFLERSLFAAAAAASAPLLSASTRGESGRRSSSDPIRVGVAGVRGRGRAHVMAFRDSPDSEVVAICDPDEGVIEMSMKAVPGAVYHRDLRTMLDDPEIDAIAIATPNHWHSLATIWALQAGKHVYVEKPLSHNVFEGHQVVQAAKKYGKLVQVGTQARSAPATREAIAWLRAGGLGSVRLARALCYKRRGSIGKVRGPQEPPETLDYDLWTGPAAMRPLMRTNLHYDWHWDFNTGNGDIGNQGVHQMDIARWGLGLDHLPVGVVGCGGRLGYDDDGNTPNTQLALFDYGEKRLLFEVRGLETAALLGAHIGVIFYGEKGYLVSASYNSLTAFDPDGAPLRTFQGGANHFQNFLDAVKAQDASVLTAPAQEGHLSAALCHLANVTYLLGSERSLAGEPPFGAEKDGNEAFVRMREHLVQNGLDPKQVQYDLGPTLAFDPRKERFTGDHAEQANRLLTREERAPFIVPREV